MLSLHLPKKHTCAYIDRTEKTLGSGLVPRMAQLLHYASVPQGPRSFGAGIQLCPFPYPLILGLTTWHKRNVGRWDPSQRPEMSLHIKAHSFFFLHLPLRRNLGSPAGGKGLTCAMKPHHPVDRGPTNIREPWRDQNCSMSTPDLQTHEPKKSFIVWSHWLWGSLLSSKCQYTTDKKPLCLLNRDVKNLN